jgi:acetyl esterase/lipase
VVDAGGVPAEWVVAPGAEDSRVIPYLHGGGYVTGSAATHRELASRISRAAHARVLVVDYRLAPEHPHPAALEDSIAAYRWILDAGQDPSSTVVVGDSAGAGLTLALLVSLRDVGHPLPSAAVCISPWANLAATAAELSPRSIRDRLVSLDSLIIRAALYSGGADLRSPLISPLYADLSQLPPLLIQVGTAEVLLEDSREVADRVRATGGDVTVEEYQDMCHLFQQLAPGSPEASEAVTSIGRFVVEHTT